MANQRVTKPRTLQGVLVRYFVRTVLLCGAAAVAWFALLLLPMEFGLLYPANAAEQQTMQAREQFMQHPETDPHTLDGTLCRWALWDGETVPDSNLQEPYLRWLQEDLTGQRGFRLGYSQFYTRVPVAGGELVLQYDYAIHYVSPALRGHLPDPQCAMVLVLIAALLGVFWYTTRQTSRFLSREAARLTEAGNAIAAQRLDLPDHSTVREFDEALTALHTLGHTLSDSLQRQWADEHRRTDELAALTHDLKTPLSIIAGHAELLAEEDLSPAQRQSVEAIGRGAERATRYLTALREAVSAEPTGEAPAPTDLAAFLAERVKTGQALCAPKQITFICENLLPQGQMLPMQAAHVARAVDNLLDNAARHTPPGGQITLRVSCADGFCRFAVQDTGPGFTPQALRHAGQLLFTTDTARGGAHQGLGLAFARRVAETHGGSLTLHNTEQGACAELTLPLPA